MTNHAETTTSDSQIINYSKTCDPGSESPVLDLSVRKTPSPSLEKNSRSSPLQGSVYPEVNNEANNNNNNDNKHDGYQARGHEVKRTQKNVQTHVYRQEESVNLSSSANHERKTPSYETNQGMLTPPSDLDSPKKAKVNTIYKQPTSTEVPTYPAYPMNIPVTMAGAPGAIMPGMFPPPTATFVPQFPLASSQVPQPYGLMPLGDLKKVTRPFKAYPKDPLAISPDLKSDPGYFEFRSRMIDSVKKSNEGTNVKMRRTNRNNNVPTSTAEDRDSAYWERRRKNNEAAKRSRDARRAKEDEIAIRAAYLESQHSQLVAQIRFLQEENSKLKCYLLGQ